MADISNTLLNLADTSRAIEWREADMQQRHLDNSHRRLEVLWRNVDLKIQQLKATSNLSALIAGFAMVVLVEAQIPENTPQGLVAGFALVTALVVSLMLYSMVTCTYLLAGILNKSTEFVKCTEFTNFWVRRCEEDWNRAFLSFSYGVPLFLVDLGLLGWVKFLQSAWTAGAVTVVVFFATIAWGTSQFSWGMFLLRNPYASLVRRASMLARSTADLHRAEGMPHQDIPVNNNIIPVIDTGIKGPDDENDDDKPKLEEKE